MKDRLPFSEALRHQLVAAAARQTEERQAAGRSVSVRRHPRRTVRMASAALATAAGSVLAMLLVPGSEPAAADVVIRFREDEVEVTLLAVEHEPHRIEEAVREAGLDVSITGVPVGPSRVGRFVGAESSGPLPPELQRLDAGSGGFRGFVLPAGWPGSLHLLVGVPAEDQEPYGVFSDAVAPGEALACRPLVGRPAGQVGMTLAATDLSIRVEAYHDGQGVELARSTLNQPPWDSWAVTAIDTVSADTVVLRLEAPGTASPRPTDPGCQR